MTVLSVAFSQVSGWVSGIQQWKQTIPESKITP